MQRQLDFSLIIILRISIREYPEMAINRKGTDMKKKPKSKIWWQKVTRDIQNTVAGARRTYNNPRTIIGVSTDNKTGTTSGYLIRLKSGDVGYYPASTFRTNPRVGSMIKGEIPKFDHIADEPTLASYAYEVICESVALVPRMWLRKVIQKVVDGKPVTEDEDYKAFPEWVLLPKHLKEDGQLVDILARVTRREGLKGLARFNDQAKL